ncbi:MAG: AIR synthase-related protein [Lachnospiraceae bacterium]|nr:AIR synthase-related protein [Lachnospiraceae bacterium]
MREKFDLKKLENEIPLKEFFLYENPVLVSKSNAVSSKLMLAAEIGCYDTVGYDCVAVCMNDIWAAGAKPILFYNNISSARPRAEHIKKLEDGIERGCQAAGIPHVGSEIKELAEIFSYDQYDLVGFAAGVLDRNTEEKKPEIKSGDVIIGLPSNGLHNNGYVAARKKLYLTKTSMEVYYESLGATLGELLMAPTKMYYTGMRAIADSNLEVKRCVQVAHGGLDRAVRKLVTPGHGAVVKQKADSIPPLYDMLHKDGNINEELMRKTFNMGIGMLMLVSEEQTDQIAELLETVGEHPVLLGLVEEGSEDIRYII